MIKRFVFGTPFPTESVVLDLPVETGPVPFLTPDGDGWTYTMQEKDIVYGLGEMPRGLKNEAGITRPTIPTRASMAKTGFPITPPTTSCSSPLPMVASA